MIYYIGYYCRKKDIGIRYGAVSAISKMDYVLSVLERQDDRIELLSRSYLLEKGIEQIKECSIGALSRLRYFSNVSGRNKLGRFIARHDSKNRLFHYCKNTIKPCDTVVLYHSTDDFDLIELLKNGIHCYVILELEEIYADVSEQENLRKSEEKTITFADAYILATEALSKQIPAGRPYSVINGTYQSEPPRNVHFDDNKIHCVYAGTFDPTKGGAAAAAAAAFLPQNYHVHILGFGTEEQTENIKKRIAEVQMTANCTVTYDGLKSGEEFIQFLQKCHIGLCTQIPDAKYTETSFPSKILVYLANGLRVLSVRIPAVEQSDVGDMLFYYDEQKPERIAEAIQNIDVDLPYDSRQRLKELDERATCEMKEIIRKVSK